MLQPEDRRPATLNQGLQPAKWRRFRCGPTRALKRVKELTHMLWTLALVLLVLWMLGLATSYTMGGLIHLLLAIALIVVLFRIIQRRRIA